MRPLLWVVAAAFAVGAAWTAAGDTFAALPGSEARITALAAAMPAALVRWSVAMLAPLAVLRIFGPIRPVAWRLWWLWAALAATQVALQGGVEATATTVAVAVEAQVRACIVAAITTGAAGWWSQRPPGLHYGLAAWSSVATIAVLVLSLWGSGPGGTRINLGSGEHRLQLLELVPVSLALAAAALGACVTEGTLGRRHVVAFVVAVGILCGLIVVRIDDRGAVLITLLTLALLSVWLLDVERRIPVLVAAPLVLWVGYWLVALAPGRAGALVDLRLAMRADPFENGLRNGDQLGLGMLAVEAGRLTGRGLAAIRATALPVGESDMVLGRLAEAWGLLGLTAWVAAFLGLVAVMLGGASRGDPAAPGRGRAPAAVACALAARFLVNVAGISGVAPLTGVVCPMLSTGDSALVSTFAALGLALAEVSRVSPAARVQHRRELAAVLMTVLVFLAMPAAALVGQATAVLRGADHAGLVTQAASGRLMFVPAPALAPKLALLTRQTLADREGSVLATDAPDGRRVVAGPPSLREAIGAPGDTAGTLEAALEEHRPPLDLGPGWLVETATGRVVGRGDVAGPGQRLERPRAWDLRALRDVDALPLPAVRVTTLDRDLAWRLDPLLRDALEAQPDALAAVLVLRDGEGAVLLESVLRRGELRDGRYAVSNLAESLWAPPGSQLKVLVAAAADMDGVPRDTLLTCTKRADGRGYVRVCDESGCEIIRDFPKGRHEPSLSIPEMMSRSCNAGAIELALLQPSDTLPTLIAAATGRPAPDLSRAHARAEAAIGQGVVELTPAQVSAAVWAATGAGERPTCELATEAPCRLEPFLPEDTAVWTRTLMEGVVTRPGGTGARARLAPPLTVVVKTGSAQDGAREDDRRGEDHAWLSGELRDEQGHRVQFTFLLVHGGVPGGTWAPRVPALAEALVAEGYLVAPTSRAGSIDGAANRSGVTIR